MNPEGISALSPGLRGTSYPGSNVEISTNPEGVAAITSTRLKKTASNCRNPFGVENIFGTLTQGSASRNPGLEAAIPSGLTLIRRIEVPPSVRSSHIFIDSRRLMCEMFTHSYDFVESKRIGGVADPMGARRVEASRDPGPFLVADRKRDLALGPRQPRRQKAHHPQASRQSLFLFGASS